MAKMLKLQAPFERLKMFNEDSADIALRKAIVLQAVKDTISTSKVKEEIRAKFEARAWIFGNDPNFIKICHEVGYEPSYIKSITKKFIKLSEG